MPSSCQSAIAVSVPSVYTGKQKQMFLTSNKFEKVENTPSVAYPDRALTPNEVDIMHKHLDEMIADTGISLNW